MPFILSAYKKNFSFPVRHINFSTVVNSILSVHRVFFYGSKCNRGCNNIAILSIWNKVRTSLYCSSCSQSDDRKIDKRDSTTECSPYHAGKQAVIQEPVLLVYRVYEMITPHSTCIKIRRNLNLALKEAAVQLPPLLRSTLD